MSLRNERLDRIHNNSKSIYDTFQYRPENGDTIGDITTAGYFTGSEYIDAYPPGWKDGLLDVLINNTLHRTKISSDGITATLLSVDSSGAFTQTFTGTPVVLPVANEEVEFPHGLGVVPTLVKVGLRCNTTDVGFPAGFILDSLGMGADTAIANLSWVQTAYDDTNVYVSFSTAGPFFGNPSTLNTSVTLTRANWSILVSAWV